jgi:hypothetical protein
VVVKALRWLFVAVVVALFVRAAADHWRDFRDVDLRIRPLWLVTAAPFTFAGGWLLPVAWARLLAAYGAALAPMEAVRIWSLAATSRYIPSGLAAVASRVVLAGREGVPRALATASTVVELVVIVGWGAVFAGAFLSTWPGWLRVAVAAGALAGIAALPVVLRAGGRLLLSRFPALDPAALETRVLFESLAVYFTNAVVKGIGFVLFAVALLPDVDAGDTWLLIGAVNAAAILGMIGVTPAGLGVREAFITVFLRDRFGFADAAALAAALRVWDLAFELTWLAIVGARARRRRPTPQPG